jgi:hypothetical protein
MSIPSTSFRFEKKCAHCGSAMLTNFERKYACSDKCRDELVKEKRKAERKAKAVKPPPVPCLQCGIVFQPKTEKGHYCSDKCMQRARYEKNPYNKETFGTGTTRNRGSKQSYEHKLKRAESVRSTLAKTTRTCVKCGEVFVPTLAAQKYCSGRCWVSVDKVKKQRAAASKIKIHADHYKVLHELQNGKCAICGTESGSNGRGDRLAVDHCHDSGNIRGLLCHRCNTALGLFKDKIENLELAVSYLKTANSRK